MNKIEKLTKAHENLKRQRDEWMAKHWHTRDVYSPRCQVLRETMNALDRQVNAAWNRLYDAIDTNPGWTWYGANHEAQKLPYLRVGKNMVTLVNPTEDTPCFVFQVGSFMPNVYVVWDYHLESALDELGGFLEDHAPGMLANEQVAEAYKEAIAEGKTEEEAREYAETDVTRLDGGNYLLSDEWTIFAEKPDRAELKEIIG